MTNAPLPTRVTLVTFSATGNTRRVGRLLLDSLCEAWGAVGLRVDITTPAARQRELCFGPEDFVLFGVPVYAGRVPNRLLPFFREKLRADGTPAAAFVTYGGRGVDDALGELGALLTEDGLRVTAGAAIPAEHAFSARVQGGRPDAEDRTSLYSFALALAQKQREGRCEPVELPCPGGAKGYYTPLREDAAAADFLSVRPTTELSLCEGCCLCASVCPEGSVSRTDPTESTGLCIHCMACVRRCPRGARSFDSEDFRSHVAWLERHATARPPVWTWL